MTNQQSQDEFEHLRGQLEEAPTLGEAQKAGKEIKVRRSPWVVRSLILILTLLFAGEMYFIGQYRKEMQRIIVSDAPMVKSYPAPEISAPLPPPPVEAASVDLAIPEPTPFPLPPELEGFEPPPVSE